MADVGDYLSDIPPPELHAIRMIIDELAPTGFQIWGLPSGAAPTLRNMMPGDSLLLLEREDFRYLGQVLHRLSEPSWALSDHIWGEQRFPIIVFLQGQMIRYAWDQFKSDFNFAPNYGMRGNTMRLSDTRVRDSSFGSEANFLAAVLRSKTHDFDSVAAEFELFAEQAEAHLQLVRDRSKQATFRTAVMSRQGARCAVCGFDILEGLEAAHLVPKQASGTDDPRNGLVLCVLHHRLFDAGIFKLDPDGMVVLPQPPHTLETLRITEAKLGRLKSLVREEAVRWNAEQARPAPIACSTTKAN
jgi:hypothetical protein